MPPLPYHPFPELPTEETTAGQFVYDDSGVDYPALWEESASMTPLAQTSTLSLTSGVEYGCGLWLEIAPPTNSAVLLTLHNTYAGKG